MGDFKRPRRRRHSDHNAAVGACIMKRKGLYILHGLLLLNGVLHEEGKGTQDASHDAYPSHPPY